MSLLELVSKPSKKPLICTLSSEAGVGKTTTAATFPKPLFIRAEDGMSSIPQEWVPDTLPIIKDATDMWEQLNLLIREEHDYKTLVIDSVTALERIFIQHVMEQDPKKPRSIQTAMGGYGAGYGAVASMHQRVRKAAGILADNKDMNIVFLAHADTEQLDLPDEDPYSRYSLRLSKKSMAPYVDDVDLVGLIKLHTIVTGGEDSRKKAVSDGSRIMVVSSKPSSITKNRFGIRGELTVEFGINPLEEYVK